jgi:hypothetical protein
MARAAGVPANAVARRMLVDGAQAGFGADALGGDGVATAARGQTGGQAERR